jgi:hypothetical protein
MTLRERADRFSKATLAYGGGFDDSPMGSAVALACAWMQEHPADDDEPVTNNWVTAIGGRKEDHPLKWSFALSDGLSIGVWRIDAQDAKWKAVVNISPCFSADLARGIDTRGQVRRLLSALGITCKEGT